MENSQAVVRGKIDTVYARLKDLSVHHRFRPGQQLQIAELANLLLTSATPAREALIRLYGEGLCVSIQNKGFFAKTVTSIEMKSRYEFAFLIMRYAIERNIVAFNMRGISKPMQIRVSPNGQILNATGDLFLSHAMLLNNYTNVLQCFQLTKLWLIKSEHSMIRAGLFA